MEEEEAREIEGKLGMDKGKAPLGQPNLDEAPLGAYRSIEVYEKLELIGEGRYGQVYKAKEIRTGEIVALKKIQIIDQNKEFPINAIREINVLKNLHHVNVIELKEIVTSSAVGNEYRCDIYMVFEYIEHDLDGLLSRPEVKFTVPQVKCYMKQLLTGLHYCHMNQVLHRDIKGDNLLINNEGNLKLADFGLARSLSDSPDKLTNNVISLCFRPPELLPGATNYGPAVDMWSVGCMFAQLLFREIIFPGTSEVDQLLKIFSRCGTPNDINWPGAKEMPWYPYFKDMKPLNRCLRELFGRGSAINRCTDRHTLDLLDKMLTLDPNKRISAKDALEAEYFRVDPLPCDPKSLPKYAPSHGSRLKQQQRRNDNARRRNRPQQYGQMRPGPYQLMQPVPMGSLPPHPGHRGGGYYYPSYGGQDGGSLYLPPGWAPAYDFVTIPPYGSSGLPGYLPYGHRGGGTGGGYRYSTYPLQGWVPPHGFSTIPPHSSRGMPGSLPCGPRGGGGSGGRGSGN